LAVAVNLTVKPQSLSAARRLYDVQRERLRGSTYVNFAVVTRQRSGPKISAAVATFRFYKTALETRLTTEPFGT